jgi:nucleotide-binding universal stress UspA family protein
LVDRLDEFNEVDQQRLEELKDRLAVPKKVTVHCRLVFGNPHAEILQELQSSQATMIMMGTQGRGFLKELFVGSVSQYIARRSQVPVLLIPIRQD